MPQYLPIGISLKAYPPAGGVVDLSKEPDLKLVVTDIMNGGFDTCNFELCNYLKHIGKLTFGTRIVCKDDARNKLVFTGILTDYMIDTGVKATLLAKGDGKGSAYNKRYFYHQLWPAGTLMTQVFADTLTLTEQIYQGAFDGMIGLQLTEDTKDFAGQAAPDVWDSMSEITGFFVTPLLWYVRGGLNSDLPSLYTRNYDSGHRFDVTWDNRTVKFKDKYSIESAVNGVIVEWGDGNFYTAPVGLLIPGSQNPPGSFSPGPRDYSVLAHNQDRDKFVNINNEVHGLGDAQGYAGALLSRFNTVRPVGAEVTICGGKITAHPPVSSVLDPNWPWWLVESGWVVRVQGLPPQEAPFNEQDHYIAALRKDFSTGTLTLTCGEMISLGSTIREVNSYVVDRPAIAAFTGFVSQPLADSDQLSRVGPSSVGNLPANNTNDVKAGIPIFILNKSKEFEEVIHPGIIADEGIEVNFASDGALGLKGFCRVIPSKITDWEVCFTPPEGDTTVPTDSITIKLYDNYPVGNSLQDIVVSSAKCAKGLITPNRIFPVKGKIAFEVTSPMSNSGGFQIALHGIKLYPELGLNT